VGTLAVEGNGDITCQIETRMCGRRFQRFETLSLWGLTYCKDKLSILEGVVLLREADPALNRLETRLHEKPAKQPLR
jgi:hypothetical protein